MTLDPESKYPNRRAYVIKLDRSATASALSGRVENLVTGCQREFASHGELLEFIAHDLTEVTQSVGLARRAGE